MKNNYSFVSTWNLKAPVETVRHVISDIEHWSTWWPFMRKTKKITNNSYEFEVGTWLYRLSFVMEVEILPDVTKFKAVSGDLIGEGKCTLRSKDGQAEVIFTWNVTDQRTWVYKIPGTSQVFAKLHTYVMKKGEQSLAQKVARFPLS